MQLGTYVDGRPLVYDETSGTFMVGEAPVTADQVRAYEAAGQLTWARPDIATWFHTSFPAVAPVVAEKPRNTALVVVVILAVLAILLFCCGILAAIAIPAFNAAKEEAQMKSCFANERTIEGAAQMFKAENGVMPGWITSLTPVYLAESPTCPAGGVYDWDTGTGLATCSLHGHY